MSDENLKNNEEKCLVCKNYDGEKISIFDKIEDEHITVINMLIECLSVNKEEKSSKLCLGCLEKLQVAYKFKKQYIKTTQNSQILNKKCLKCNRIYSNESKFNAHSIFHDNLKFKCDCDKLFESELQLENHKQLHLDDAKIHECKICKNQFNKTNIKKHFETTHMNYNCQRCNLTFNDQKKVMQHIQNCLNDYPMKCNVCGQKFNDFDHFKKHKHVFSEYFELSSLNVEMLIEDLDLIEIDDKKRKRKFEIDEKKRKKIVSVCEKCNEEFTDNELYVLHLNKHKSNTFTCQECNEQFTKSVTLKRHLLSHLKDKNLMQLLSESMPDKFIKTEEEILDSEIKIKNDNSIEVKDELIVQFKTEPEFIKSNDSECDTFEKIPEIDQTSLESKQTKCISCDMEFNDELLFNQHLNDVKHELKLNKTNKKSKRKQILKTNLETNLKTNEEILSKKKKLNQKNNYNCDVCSKIYSNYINLLSHELKFHEKREIKCENCDQVFNWQSHYLQHKYIIHNSNLGANCKIIIDNTNLYFQCDFCKKLYSSFKCYQRHRNDMWNSVAEQEQEQQQIVGNQLTINGKHPCQSLQKCDLCGFEFSMKQYLAMHIKRHHSGDDAKKFLCTFCGKKFLVKDYLLIHIRRHTGEKPFICEICHKKFTSKYELSTHMKYHTNERNYVCSVCGFRFVRHYSLKVHMRTHTGERPFKCEHCPSAFAQRNDWKKHMRRHTGDLYRCEICQQNSKSDDENSQVPTFLEKFQLNRHKLYVHDIKVKAHTGRLCKAESKKCIDDINEVKSIVVTGQLVKKNNVKKEKLSSLIVDQSEIIKKERNEIVNVSNNEIVNNKEVLDGVQLNCLNFVDNILVKKDEN